MASIGTGTGTPALSPASSQAVWALVLEGQHDLEQRVPAERPGRVERLDQPLERQVLMWRRRRDGLAAPGRAIRRSWVAARSPRITRVLTKNPIRSSSVFTGPAGEPGCQPGCRHPHRAGQQRGQGRLQGHVDGHALDAGGPGSRSAAVGAGPGSCQLGIRAHRAVARHAAGAAGRTAAPAPRAAPASAPAASTATCRASTPSPPSGSWLAPLPLPSRSLLPDARSRRTGPAAAPTLVPGRRSGPDTPRPGPTS